jgi:branched-subunit amino acid aminotransferase/4-amino-4-deoxychorismate lyase
MASHESAAARAEPIAYLNGRWLPVSQAGVTIFDGGFMLGATVAEQLRTFGGKLFRLDMHLDRLERSLGIIGVDPGLRRSEFAQIATDLAARNHKLLDPADDLGLTMFVTPGPYAAYAAAATHFGPTVCIHTQPLAFANWADKYHAGDALVVSEVMQVPAACWPAELKCRSRMHYFLADRAARQRQPGARALLLDERGFVTEASSANLLVHYRDVGLVSPPKERILPGVTVAVLEELAGRLGIAFSHRDLTADDVAAADEVLLSSTSPCVWSVTRLNGQPIADGQPGPIARRVREAFSRLVGLDIEAQAKRFALRA